MASTRPTPSFPTALGSDRQDFHVVVRFANAAPSLNPIGDPTILAGQALTLALGASDPEGDALTYAASNLPQGAVFNPATWKTEYPHPAFDAMDAQDGFWAARIAACFSDDMIREIVKAAKLSNRSST